MVCVLNPRVRKHANKNDQVLPNGSAWITIITGTANFGNLWDFINNMLRRMFNLLLPTFWPPAQRGCFLPHFRAVQASSTQWLRQVHRGAYREFQLQQLQVLVHQHTARSRPKPNPGFLVSRIFKREGKAHNIFPATNDDVLD